MRIEVKAEEISASFGFLASQSKRNEILSIGASGSIIEILSVMRDENMPLQEFISGRLVCKKSIDDRIIRGLLKLFDNTVGYITFQKLREEDKEYFSSFCLMADKVLLNLITTSKDSSIHIDMYLQNKMIGGVPRVNILELEGISMVPIYNYDLKITL